LQEPQTTKAATKAKEAAKTAKIAKNSVKTTPPQKAAVRLEKNAAQESKVRTAKSGKWAESQAKMDAKTFERQSPYLENQVVTVRSANVKPYKTTGGAGSTARRKNEITDTRKLKKK
jgi:bisphosphoglycerate-dependent phosphoglycerate mutase